MIVRITMKDPDCHIEELDTGMVLESHNLPKKVQTLFDKHFHWREYLDVELDTEKGTCTVIPVEEEV